MGEKAGWAPHGCRKHTLRRGKAGYKSAGRAGRRAGFPIGLPLARRTRRRLEQDEGSGCLQGAGLAGPPEWPHREWDRPPAPGARALGPGRFSLGPAAIPCEPLSQHVTTRNSFDATLSPAPCGSESQHQ